jgi:hypothetical protein
MIKMLDCCLCCRKDELLRSCLNVKLESNGTTMLLPVLVSSAVMFHAIDIKLVS